MSSTSFSAKSREQLLSEINSGLPSGVDWKRGAETYLRRVFDRDGRENVEPYLLHKPFAQLQGDADDRSRAVFLDLIHNFSNVLQLLRLPAGARILDVACGAGWLSQWLMRLGFEVTGVDVCSDLLHYARRRLSEDPLLRLPAEKLDSAFILHDLEAAPLAPSLCEFDAAIFESCLHHFHDPISALSHTALALTDDGVAVLIEGENRQESIKAEYLEVMREFATIERPYRRSELRDILMCAGLPHVQFFGPVNGWYAPDSPETAALAYYVRYVSDAGNRAVCAKKPEALQRIVPGWRPVEGSPIVARSGVSPGVDGYAWSAPQCEFLVERACRRIAIQIGSHLPDAQRRPQYVCLATNLGDRREVVLSPGGGAMVVEFSDLSAGTEIHCVSNGVFSPAWEGQQDRRVLSFRVAIRNEFGELILPTT